MQINRTVHATTIYVFIIHVILLLYHGWIFQNFMFYLFSFQYVLGWGRYHGWGLVKLLMGLIFYLSSRNSCSQEVISQLEEVVALKRTDVLCV